jgi:hypothetical protein
MFIIVEERFKKVVTTIRFSLMQQKNFNMIMVITHQSDHIKVFIL